MSSCSSHRLVGSFPTEVVKTLDLNDDGEIEETVTGENHVPGHLSGNHIECSCGEEWEGVTAEEEARNHLLRQTAVNRIRDRYEGTRHRGWVLHSDSQPGTLYWSYEDADDLPLHLYATPFYEEADGIAVQIHNMGGEELVVKRLAEEQSPEEIVENYVEIMTQYIDQNWMEPCETGEGQEG